MDQLDVNNGVDWHMKEKEVMFSSDDILLKIRIVGIFHQELNLLRSCSTRSSWQSTCASTAARPATRP